MPDSRDPSASVLLEIFRRMALLKINDEKIRTAIRTGKLSIPYFSYRGQEAVPAAISVLLEDRDYICTIYRGIHDILAKGMAPRILWAEIAGRLTGSCKGKGGPMHLTDPSKGIMITTGIVGSSMPVALGLGWSAQLAAEDRVTVAYFGDGASNIGAFHESLNLAAIWKLPILFVCQNNRFAEHTAYEKMTSVARVSDRAAAYGIQGVTVDGNDPIAIYDAARKAVKRARAGDGPTLIEADTFRFEGHVFGDPADYIPKDLIAKARDKDCYPAFRAFLSQHIADETTLARIEAQAAAAIEDAAAFALESPFPGMEELRRDVFDTEIPT